MPKTQSISAPSLHVRYYTLTRSDIALFRFLLESYGHVGLMSVLDKYTGLIKIESTTDMRERLDTVFDEISQSVAIQPVHFFAE